MIEDERSEESGAASDGELIADPVDRRSSRPWLALLTDAEQAFERYQEVSDNVDRLYSDLEKLAATTLHREFQIFWANLEVIRPSIYARPPVPVVTPRFRDRDPLQLKAAEILERALITDVSLDNVDETMKLIRDDLAANARGVAWVRYAPDDDIQAPVDHIQRRDFLHEPARNWSEVSWVARRAYLTRSEGVERFGPIFNDAAFTERGIGGGEDDGYHGEPQAEVWEIWHKGEELVAWVTEGVEDVLDLREPMVELTGFFPCPRPAYGTLQRGTLIPVPDMVYYRDQIEEINELTARISALSESLRMRGFYPAGAQDVGDAIEAAVKSTNNAAILVPVNNFSALGGSTLRDSIIWLPVAEVAGVIDRLIALRRQMMDDVYQITGISDIMRGTTVASETLGAQQLKSQYGSVRIRERQNELARIARDIIAIKGEIMAENLTGDDLLDMSQVQGVPTRGDQKKRIAEVNAAAEAQIKAATNNPQIAQMAQQNPEQAQQVIRQVAQQVEQLVADIDSEITIDDVVELFRDQRVRPFVLDIETDSTIQPDEDREKQRRTEFMTAIGGFISQSLPLVTQVPATAPFVAETLKFTAAGFRAGRDLDSTIDEFADTMKQMAEQAQQKQGQPDPAQQAEAQQLQAAVEKTKAETAKLTAEAQKTQAEVQQGQPNRQGQQAQPDPATMMKLQLQKQAQDQRAQIDTARVQLEQQRIEIEKMRLAIEAERAKLDGVETAVKMVHDAEQRAEERAENGGMNNERVPE